MGDLVVVPTSPGGDNLALENEDVRVDERGVQGRDDEGGIS